MPHRVASQRRLPMAIGLVLLLAGSGLAADRKGNLTPEEQKVINHLVNDWGKDYSVTSVDIAMDAVGVKPSDKIRFRIGRYIKQHPELHAVIRRWGWVTLVLTADEKLMARTLINAERAGQPALSVAELARAVGLSKDQTKRGLVMLERYEILQRDQSIGGAGYRVAPRYLKWEPRLDFLFHTVTLESGRRFNTNWAVDFLLLVSSKFANEKVIIDDSSPEGTTPIRVVFDKGKLVSAEPASTVVFRGGGWGVNNLFRSEEVLEQWLKRYPELKDKPRAPITQVLEEIKKRQKSWYRVEISSIIES